MKEQPLPNLPQCSSSEKTSVNSNSDCKSILAPHSSRPLGGVGVSEKAGSTQKRNGVVFDDNNSVVSIDSCSLYSTVSIYDNKPWDISRIIPPQLERKHRSKRIVVCLKLTKFIAYILCLIFILGGAVLSKVSLLHLICQLNSTSTLETSDINWERIYTMNTGENGSDVDVVMTLMADGVIDDRLIDVTPANASSFNELLSSSDSNVTSRSHQITLQYYWYIMLILLFPNLITLSVSGRQILFKRMTKPTFTLLTLTWFIETCYTSSICTFIFAVIPSLGILRSTLLLPGVCLVPCLLNVISTSKPTGKPTWWIKVILNVMSVVCQLTALCLWRYEGHLVWVVPLCLVCLGLPYWENYVDRSSPCSVFHLLADVQDGLRRCRAHLYLWMSVWRSLLTVGLTFMFAHMNVKSTSLSSYLDLGNIFSEEHHLVFKLINLTSSNLDITVLEQNFPLPAPQLVLLVTSTTTSPCNPLVLFLSCTLSIYLIHIFSKFACKVRMQRLGFALPIHLTTPCLVVALHVITYYQSVHIFDMNPPASIFWYQPTSYLPILWYLSYLWITQHIWFPRCERMAKSESLFTLPVFSMLLADIHFSLNRKNDNRRRKRRKVTNLNSVISSDGITMCDDNNNDYDDDDSIYESLDDPYDSLPAPHKNSLDMGVTPSPAQHDGDVSKIYICATMWHEIESEMIQFLKSVFRLDEDQSARLGARRYLMVSDPDYYEFETHIFFDDAFTSKEGSKERIVNSFVTTLIQCVDLAASAVHRVAVRVGSPEMTSTPYGGRLTWTMPGGNLLVVHLKDKTKIRHKKRWSQVMYMYYLLGHRIYDSKSCSSTTASNTYLLALDGDTDFQPQSVLLLLDLMKKDKNVGAACGRIHPVGQGPMAWYQKFEYAIGHWFQKATEHVIGCVLCAPGCFSLFRGEALMSDNVAGKYTTTSSQASHYVQYDQGEDRWLCTLLLQKGYRVEYCAAADAYTYCPETFSEFFNQRRRWIPSTLANILDLLSHGKDTRRVNDCISSMYLMYQWLLLFTSIIGPGTIFLMIVGAMSLVFSMSEWSAFWCNLIPVAAFTCVCFTTKPATQVVTAGILSVAYALLMLAVTVGIIIQIHGDGIVSPSSVFLFFIISSFLLAALLHPQEIECICHGFLYLLSVPSMYLLLILYSLANINDVSWGTREVLQKPADTSSKSGLEAGRSDTTVPEDGGGVYTFKCGSLFKLACCLIPGGASRQPACEEVLERVGGVGMMWPGQPAQEMELVEVVTTIEDVEHYVRRDVEWSHDVHRGRGDDDEEDWRGVDMEEGNFIGATVSQVKTCSLDSGVSSMYSMGNVDPNMSIMGDEMSSMEKKMSIMDDKKSKTGWMKEVSVRSGKVSYLDVREDKFWQELLDKYLRPLDEDPEHKKEIVRKLKELRDSVFIAFLLINACFVLVVFLLQLRKDMVYVAWPWSGPDGSLLKLEPIALLFFVVFIIIMFIQVFAMLSHRLTTLSLLLSTTSIFPGNEGKGAAKSSLTPEQAVEFVKDLQRLEGSSEVKDIDDGIAVSSQTSLHRSKSRLGGVFARRFLVVSQQQQEEYEDQFGNFTQQETLNVPRMDPNILNQLQDEFSGTIRLDKRSNAGHRLPVQDIFHQY